MKERTKSENLILLLIGGAAICIVGGLFIGINSYVHASSGNGPVEVPTYYEENIPQKEASPDYVKPELTVVENELMRCNNANAISAEEAAELGAQYLWDLFQVDLNDKVVYMFYAVDPSKATPYWHGDVYDRESDIKDIYVNSQYGFSIEAVTGEPSGASRMNNNDTGKTLAYQTGVTQNYYKENCSEYLELALGYAKKQSPFNAINAEFHDLSVTIAPGYDFAPKPGTIFFLEPESPIADDPNVIKVPYGEEGQASTIEVVIKVTYENGNQAIINIDSVTKEMIAIQTLYNGIDHDPGSLG